jgi:hypothetical protein
VQRRPRARLQADRWSPCAAGGAITTSRRPRCPGCCRRPTCRRSTPPTSIPACV